MTITTVEISSRTKLSAQVSSSPSARGATASAKSGEAVSVDAGEIGFLLQAPIPEGTVALLTWPLVVGTWSGLSRNWRALQGDRQFLVPQPIVNTWMSEAAGGLCKPFQDACTAESTIGAVLGRLPIGVAVGVAKDASEALAHCLDAYAAALLPEKRAPMRVLITDQGPLLDQWQTASKHSWRLGTLGNWQNEVTLRVWQDGPAPLALELSRLMTQAIARKQEAPTKWNPIYDAMESKVRSMPPSLRLLHTPKKRGG